jgi:hypothetical protein
MTLALGVYNPLISLCLGKSLAWEVDLSWLKQIPPRILLQMLKQSKAENSVRLLEEA